MLNRMRIVMTDDRFVQKNLSYFAEGYDEPSTEYMQKVDLSGSSGAADDNQMDIS